MNDTFPISELSCSNSVVRLRDLIWSCQPWIFNIFFLQPNKYCVLVFQIVLALKKTDQYFYILLWWLEQVDSPSSIFMGKEKQEKKCIALLNIMRVGGGEKRMRRGKEGKRGMKISTVPLMTGDYLTSINYLIYENCVFVRRRWWYNYGLFWNL